MNVFFHLIPFSVDRATRARFGGFFGQKPNYPEITSFALLSALCRLAHNEEQQPFNPFRNQEYVTDSGVILSVNEILGISVKKGTQKLM